MSGESGTNPKLRSTLSRLSETNEDAMAARPAPIVKTDLRPKVSFARRSPLHALVVSLFYAPVAAGVLFWGWGMTWLYVVAGVLLLASVAQFTGITIASKRLKNRLREHTYRVCLQCQYPLEREPTRGTCPECGRTVRDKT